MFTHQISLEDLNQDFRHLIASFASSSQKSRRLWIVTRVVNGSHITFFETEIGSHKQEHQSLISALKIYNDEK